MKMHVFSDLHCEFNGYAPINLLRPHTPADADLVVCAGDLTQDPRHGEMLLSKHFPEFPSVYVAGNHEFYGECITDFDEQKGFTLSRDPVHRLECDELIIAGEARFLGCTLWTDYGLFEDRDRSMAVAEIVMSDHRQILERREDGTPRLFKPADALSRHRESIAWLRQKLAEPVKIPTVVVTHHAPHPKSVPTEFEFDEATPAFCSDLSSIIEEFQQAVWIHGHTHTSFDYKIGDTRIVCNPYGYGYENSDFNPALIVEV